MFKFIRNISSLLVLLILSGIVLHETIPHHHHMQGNEIHSCCINHEHDSEHEDDHHQSLPCNLLSNIFFENNEPSIQVFTKEVSDYQPVLISQSVRLLNINPMENKIQKFSFFYSRWKISQSIFYQSIAHRAPPLA